MASQAPSSTVTDEKNVVELEKEPTSPAPALTEDEKQIIEKQVFVPRKKIGYFSLFRYANKVETLIMVIAALASIIAGAVLPLMTLVYGNFAGSFTSFSVDAVAADHFKHQINKFTLYFVYLGMLTHNSKWQQLQLTNLRHCIIGYNVHQHSWFLVYRRADHPTDPGALLEGNF